MILCGLVGAVKCEVECALLLMRLYVSN